MIAAVEADMEEQQRTAQAPAARLRAALERRAALLAAVLVALIALAYGALWPTPEAFLRAIDHGQRPLQDFSLHYYPMACALRDDPTPVTGYYYTAFFALLVGPLCALPLPDARVVWGALQLGAIALLALVSARLPRLDRLGSVGALALVLTSVPTLNNLSWGQVSVPLTALVLAALLAQREGRSAVAGALLGAAIAIKLYPAIFLLGFAIRRDLRATAWAALSFALLYAALPALALGPRAWLEFEALVRQSLVQADWVPLDVNSQYAPHVLGRLHRLLLHAPPGGAVAALAPVGSALLALGAVLASWRLERDPSLRQSGLPFVPLFLALPFLVQTSWPHYFAFLPVCQALLWRRAWDRRHEGPLGALALALPALSVALSSVPVFALFSSWRAYSAWGSLFFSSAALLLAVAVELRRGPRG